jgi:von Willebrand factor type A domain/Aerotolerance regulator N-terminal
MTLLGLTLQQLGILFGAVGAGVTILYILKLRRRRVRVPFAKLWDRVMKEKESTSLFSRLKRLLSLLLQLAFLFLLTAALGDPRLSSEVLEGRHIILLIDASGSMKATDGKRGTRMAAARSEAKEIVRGMNGTDVLMLVRMDAQVTPLSPFESDEKALLQVVETVKASDTRADLPRALKFCGDALRRRKNPLLILVSDGAFPSAQLAAVQLDELSGKLVPGAGRAAAAAKAKARTKAKAKAKAKVQAKAKGKAKKRAGAAMDLIDLRGVGVRYVPVGSSRDNVGIVAFNARRYVRNKMSFEIFMEVINFRDKPVELDLQLLADGEVIEVQRLKLAKQERARYTCDPEDKNDEKKRAWCDLTANGELLEARLVAPGSTADKPKPLDAFPLDDRAFALLPRRSKQKVLLVSEGNLYLEGALLLERNVEIHRLQPTQYSAAAAAKVDAVIFDGYYPASPPPVHALVFNPPEKGGPFKVTGRLQGPLITEQDRKHAVMRWVTLKDVNIGAAARFARGPGVTVLAAAFRDAIIVAGSKKGLKTVCVGFDARKSDLVLRVAFPMLVLNSLDWFSGDSASLVTSYRTGATWSVRVQGAKPGEEATVTGPDHRTVNAPVNDGKVLVHGNLVGLYNVTQGGGQARLAANLADPLESNIKPRPAMILGGRRLEAPTGFGIALRREIWIYLLLAAIGLTLLEWLTYNRRITV